MRISSLGIDVASKDWRSIGSAVVTCDDSSWSSVVPGVLAGSGVLTPSTLADQIDVVARKHGVAIVSLDGPQGWREPNPPPRHGVGRHAEYEARTQGKTGAFGHSYPQTQLGWIKFSIALFEQLLSKPDVSILPEDGVHDPARPGYSIVECFPTVTWRSLGIVPLPGKATAKAADVAAWAAKLWARVGLPNTPPTQTHDDLQGVVAAIVGASALGGPLNSRRHGKRDFVVPTSGDVPSHRVEGFIWDVDGRPGLELDQPTPTASADAPDDIGDGEIPSVPSSTDGLTVVILCGDSHSFWRSHQQTPAAFDAIRATIAVGASRPYGVSFDAGTTWQELELQRVSDIQLSWKGVKVSANKHRLIEALVQTG